MPALFRHYPRCRSTFYKPMKGMVIIALPCTTCRISMFSSIKLTYINFPR